MSSERPGTRGPLRIAIDGPSGSGKSSVSRAVARALGLGYLDTGAMYRAVTWWCLDEGVDLTDVDAVARAAREVPLVMGTDPADPSVTVGGRDIGTEIRSSEISSVVSVVATNLDVRAELRRRQRDLMARVANEAGGVVAEGRDITTVVAPDADVRILAVEVVRCLPSGEVERLLCGVLENEGDPNVCTAAVEVLAEAGTAEAVPTLRRLAARFPSQPMLPFAARVAIERITGSGT